MIYSLIVTLFIFFATFYFEKKKNNRIKRKTLSYELECNLNYINEIIFLTNNKESTGIYLDNVVLLSVINSHQIINLKENSIHHLLAFNNKVKMINERIYETKGLNLANNDVFISVLRGAKTHLKQILAYELQSEEWWKENELKGLKTERVEHTLDSSERIKE